MKLRPYQKDVLDQVESEFNSGTKEVVIAASPSSGKTTMAMSFIKDHANSTFLILTHGTNVLKHQWAKELKNGGIVASTVPGQCRVTYGLPQGKKQIKKLNKIDYLIVDEAHEFTFAKTVQGIIKVLSPNKIIYLTGTPSKFIRRGIKTIVVPAIDLIKDGYISDLYIGMVSTNAKLVDKDYNGKGDLKESSSSKIEQTVSDDLDELLKSMHRRLCETDFFKSSPELRKLVEWGPTLGKLHKTMIACQSVKQAKKVEDYFDKNGITTISSNYENDRNSDNIQKFIDDSEAKVLIVVDRGILGFNMPDMVNVVDLTCSKNIDRTYQLFARVMRKNERFPNKYFFKFADEEHMLLAKFYMNASLMLMFKDFIEKYNGKNLNACEIIVHRPVETRKRKDKRDNEEQKESQKSLSPTGVNVEPLFYETVRAGELLIDIYNKIGERTNEYAYVTFEEILRKEFGKKGRGYSNHNKDKTILLDMAKSGSKKPAKRTFLANALTRFTAPSQKTYDSSFANEISKYWNVQNNFRWTEQEAIEEVTKTNVKKVSELRKQKPGMFEAADRYNWEYFKKAVENKFPNKRKNDPAKTLAELDQWIKAHGRIPREHVKDPTEKKMGAAFRNRLRKNPKWGERYGLPYGRKTRYVKVRCVETNEIFESVTGALVQFGDYSTGNLIRAIKKATKYRGYHWEYVVE